MKPAFLVMVAIVLLLSYGLVRRVHESPPAYPPPQIVVNVPPAATAPPPPLPALPQPTCPMPTPVKPPLFITSIDSGSSGASECEEKGAKCIAMKDPRLVCSDRLLHVRKELFERHRAGDPKVKRITLATSPIIFDDVDEKKAFMLAVCQRRDEGALEW